MAEPVRWRAWLLVCFWIVHMVILSHDLTAMAISILMLIANREMSFEVIIEPIGFLLSFAFEYSEIKAFKRRDLSALFYLQSQIYKSLFYSWLLYMTVSSRSPYYRPSRSDVLLSIGEAFAYYMSLMYAVFTLYSHRKKHQNLSASRFPQYLSSGIVSEPGSTMFSIPSGLNSSHSITAETPRVMKLVAWINSTSTWTNRLPRSLQPLYELSLYMCRSLLCYVPMFLLLPFNKRLPGEQKRPLLVSENPLFESWDYPRPTTEEDWSVAIGGGAIRGAHPNDEESAVSTLRLDSLWSHERLRREPNHASRPTRQISSRLLGPRYLCFVTNKHSPGENPGYVVRKVDDWLAQNNSQVYPSYIFISYTRRQFYTQTKFDFDTPLEVLKQLKTTAQRDQALLTNQALIAAQQAKVPAFWVDFECVQDDEAEEGNMEDVYRICDIVRSSHSLAIVLSPSLDDKYEHDVGGSGRKAEWLLEWGKRVWTVPEALLCPSEHRIAIYDTESDETEYIAKRNLAGRVWDDADSLRQLIDHYESSLHLTQLELISIALEALHKRQTDVKNAGDVAYALMGLLRLRPKVNKADTDFQAFARLSLANDSDKILERIISLHNPTTESTWHDMDDTWNAKLWHIDPLFQIADVDDGNTLVVGDASGTSIDWSSLKPIDFYPSKGISSTLWYFIRIAPRVISLYAMMWAYFTLILLPEMRRPGIFSTNPEIMAQVRSNLFWAYIVPISCGLALALIIPFQLAVHFKSPFVATQARMFGLQGRADLSKVESSLFGSSCGRLKWATDVDEIYGETDNRPDFTVIDTTTCTAMYVRANNPPTMAFIGAREGGLLRMLLCSYDQVTGKFVKESVIRINSVIVQRMPRLARFRFALASASFKDDLAPRNTTDSERIDIPNIPEFRSLDDI